MVKIAAIQNKTFIEKNKNIERALKLANLAADEGALIICFQQLFNTFWFPKEINDNYFSLAETEEGATISELKTLSRKYGTVFIAPIFEEGENQKFYNTAFIISSGTVCGKYRKMHLPRVPLWEEKYYFSTPDDEIDIIETPYAKIGIQICWDNFFPEGTRILALKGAEIIFSPTASAFDTHKRWERMISANAMANGVYILRINRTGKESDKQVFYGKSFCVDTTGELISHPAGNNDCIYMADIDLKEIERTRKLWTFFDDRLPEKYCEIVRAEKN